MTNQSETRLPWGVGEITIKGRNAGIKHLTVFFDDEKLNILDFLNNSLIAEYAALYEAIMSKYEAKLKSGSIFDHGFPETTFTPKRIEPIRDKPSPSGTDEELIKILLTEYNICRDCLKPLFKNYEPTVEKWFNSLPDEEKK